MKDQQYDRIFLNVLFANQPKTRQRRPFLSCDDGDVSTMYVCRVNIDGLHTSPYPSVRPKGATALPTGMDLIHE